MNGRTVALSALLLLTAGCASLPSWQRDWMDDKQLREAAKEGTEDEVVLYRGRRFTFQAGPKYSTQEQGHEVKVVRTEAKADDAEVRITHAQKSKLVELKARVLFPDGRSEVVEANRMMESKADTQEGRSVSYWAFRFPRVVPGSVLEYFYTIDHPYLRLYLNESMTGEAPVRRYELSLTGDPKVIWAATVYGVKQDFEKGEEDGRWLLSWRGSDLPGQKAEQLAAPWQVDGPWWAFRVKQVAGGGYFWEANLTWDTAMNDMARRYYIESKLYDGVDLVPDVAGCTDAACKTQRAWNLVRERTRFDGFADPEVTRTMKEVLDSGRATSSEKALLLRRMLSQVGVEAELAALVRPLSGYVDRNFPNTDSFNHLVLSVPSGKGRLWLDPSCEFCEPGTLPAWSNGAEVLRFFSSGTEAMASSTQTSFGVTSATAEPPSLLESTLNVQVHPDGAASVKSAYEFTGAQAHWRRYHARNLSAAELALQLERSLLAGERTAELVSTSPLKCPAPGRCSLGAETRIPAFATLQEDRLIVPLSLLRSSVDDLLERDERRGDIVIDEPQRYQQAMSIQVPEGYALEPSAVPARESSPAFSSEFAVEAKPGAVTVRRSLTVKMGAYPKAGYESLRRPVRAFSAFREAVLVFRKAPATVAAPK